MHPCALRWRTCVQRVRDLCVRACVCVRVCVLVRVRVRVFVLVLGGPACVHAAEGGGWVWCGADDGAAQMVRRAD